MVKNVRCWDTVHNHWDYQSNCHGAPSAHCASVKGKPSNIPADLNQNAKRLRPKWRTAPSTPHRIPYIPKLNCSISGNAGKPGAMASSHRWAVSWNLPFTVWLYHRCSAIQMVMVCLLQFKMSAQMKVPGCLLCVMSQAQCSFFGGGVEGCKEERKAQNKSVG